MCLYKSAYSNYRIFLVDSTTSSGYNDGSVSVIASGGVSPYSFWSGPNGYTASTQNITNIIAGTYNLYVTDDNGCIQIFHYCSRRTNSSLSVSIIFQI